MNAPKRKTILVVDDDPQIRKLLRTLLERAAYAVVEAQDGQLAVEAFRRHPVDLVITDLIMPEKEGIETISELRKLKPAVKIIAISGGGKLDPHTYLNIARSLGAAATMTKPIDTGRLTTTVGALLTDRPAGAHP